MSDHLTYEQLELIQVRLTRADEGDPRAFLACAYADISDLLAEVWRLRRWKAEALPILDGLQDLGRALDLPIGQRITGPAALKAVERLQAQRREALALANAEVARWERDNHTPTVWAADIRDALEADDA